jgi:filamentous hemagglutinin family protein
MKSKTLLSLLAATGAFLNAEMASAQSLPPSVRTPQADKTLGTQVSGNGNNFNITGGLNRGQTLFHSFKDFSIPTGGAANFNNPAGTRDIITRVTGSLFSDINGTLNSNGANFLLINPNGVVFGPNARLNVGKAFAASTASGVDLIDGQGRQITFGTNPNGDAPLIKINPNVFFNVSRLNMGANVPNNPGIVNYGKLQTNNDSQYIGLIGGNVTLDGKYGGGKIFAPGGRIDLGGLNSAGTVSTDAQGLVFGGNGLVRGDVLLTDGASVSARANGTLGAVNPFFSNLAVAGSNININANNLNVLNSGATKSKTRFAAIDNGLAENSGVKTQPAGNINVNATGLVNLDNANIKNTLRSGAEGKIGDVKINANSLSLINGSIISSTTAGKGNAGDINVTTTGDISISGTTPQSTKLAILDNKGSFIFSTTAGRGDAGKITLDTQGRGKLLLSGASLNNSIEKDAVGNSKGIEISAQSVDLKNGSFIFSDNDGQGDAGNISIKTIGDISLSGSNPPSTIISQDGQKLPVISSISSNTNGKGNAGKITIDTQNQGKFSLSNRADIVSTIGKNAIGNGNDINISAREVDIWNEGSIFSDNSGGKGDAGNINIKTTGDISISGSTPQSTSLITTDKSKQSIISSSSAGQGNAGKITIDTQNQGKFLLNESRIFSAISPQAVGNGRGISISAREIDIRNGSGILSDNVGGKGDAGSIDLKTTGDISISGSTPQSTAPITDKSKKSFISSSTNGKGTTGKITIDTQKSGNLLLSNNTVIENEIEKSGVGNSNGIAISAREIDIRNQGSINSTNRGGKGNAGNIDIQNSGKLSLSNNATISTGIRKDAVGNGGDITIVAREFDLRNQSFIESNTFGKGDAGNIDIKTIGDISLSNAFISGSTSGQGNAGKITIDTQNRGNFSLDRASIDSIIDQNAVGNSNGINISARAVDLKNTSSILSDNFGGIGTAGNINIDSTGNVKLANNSSITSSANFVKKDTPTANIKGDAGNIIINTKGDLELTDKSAIISNNFGQGKTGDISLNSDRITLNSGSFISADSLGRTGGNIQLTTSDLLLLRNSSDIATRSDSNEKNGNGGNITINSPLIIALPGSNDISADAIGGNGGRIDIISKGLFGIKYRPKGQDSLFTNDITSSSTFGQSGTVNISTPGTDPGKDSTQLPNVPTDASNQIAQTCGASRENKFIVAGRGGIPANANDPLTSDVVWQDARGTNSQPTASSATTDPTKLAPPATGLVFDGKGKATLIAAGTEGQPTGTSVVCPNVVKK